MICLGLQTGHESSATLSGGDFRANNKRRNLPDLGISSDDVLFGDCIVIEAVKA